MTQKEFVNYVAEKIGIRSRELIEKDIILQSILHELSKTDLFDSFAFKGGTCLIKCYFGYYRFSEDLDFTYLNQMEFSAISEKQIRKILSEKIDLILLALADIAQKHGLYFKPEKQNARYVGYGASNKLVTFKLWYGAKQEAFVKIQINFVEKLLYPVRRLKAKSLIGDVLDKELGFLFPEWQYLLEPVKLNAYSLEEILVEKIRAVLTRKGIKSRDLIDIFLITNKNKASLDSFKPQIISKTEFVLGYEKYQKNIINKDFSSFNGFAKEEEKLLIHDIPKGFEMFLEEFRLFVQSLAKEIAGEDS
ncbi:MAG: nucleotidyl transferase AbiEii/AbiGii toxin family protein [Candidatus Woesearchaeota archaeon]